MLVCFRRKLNAEMFLTVLNPPVCFPWAAVCDQIRSSGYLHVFWETRTTANVWISHACSATACCFLFWTKQWFHQLNLAVIMFSWRTVSDIFVLIFLGSGRVPAWQTARTKGQYWKYLVWGILTVTTQQVWTAAKLDKSVQFSSCFRVPDVSDSENKTF